MKVDLLIREDLKLDLSVAHAEPAQQLKGLVDGKDGRLVDVKQIATEQHKVDLWAQVSSKREGKVRDSARRRR